MHIIYNDSDEANVCYLLNRLDKCIIKGEYSSLTNNYSNDWLPRTAKRRLEWVNANYNLSINYPDNYDYNIKKSIKRAMKRVIHKLIKFNLMSICVPQTEFNAQLVRIQNHQYHLLGQMSLEIEMLKQENDILKEKVENLVNRIKG